MASNATTVVDSSRNISRNRANAWISVLLAGHLVGVMFIVANLALASHLATFRDANPPRSIQTIRRFYAGLNDYMETGDATAVAQTLAPGALALVPEDGAMGEDSALLTYLLALRSTAPQRRFSIERIDTSQEIAIASVRRSDTAVSSREFFRVRDDRIVQHWSAAPDSVLRHTLNPSPLRAELRSSAHLVIAELDLPKQWKGPLLIDGPALILIQHGRLALVGDGSSQIVDVASGDISVPGPGERASLVRGRPCSFPNYGQLWSPMDRTRPSRSSARW